MENNKEIRKILKESLNIVNNLAILDINDDIEDIEVLINKAKILIKNPLWKLK